MKIAFVFTDNKVWLWRFMENYGVYILDMGIVSVDIYFFLSGCFVSYMHFREKPNEELVKTINYKKKLIQFFILITKRFIRYVFRYCDSFEKHKKQCNKINIKLLQ